MKNRRNLKNIILILILVLLILMASSVGFGESQNSLLPAPGEIGLKVLGYSSGYGLDQEIEVTMTVDGKNIAKESKIVLVIDSSGSMKNGIRNGYGNERKIDLAKEATKDFIDVLLTEKSNVEIAIVDFDTKVRASSEFCNYKQKKKLTRFMNQIKAEGGTNIQAGLDEAQRLLDEEEDDEILKYVVLLSDGVPTFHYYAKSIEGYEFLKMEDYSNKAYSRNICNKVDYTQNFFWRRRDIRPFDENDYALIQSFEKNRIEGPAYGKHSDNLTILSTLWQADQLKKSGVDTLFTIAYDLENNSNAQNILKHCASSEDVAYDTTIEIASTFNNIAHEIKYAATEAEVVFQLNKYLEFVSVNKNSGNDEKFIIRKNGEMIEDVSNILNIDENGKVRIRLGTVSEVNPGKLAYIPSDLKKYKDMNHLSYYTMTYKLALKDDYKNNFMIYNMPIMVNDYAHMAYMNVEGEETSKNFPNIPTITVKGGSIKIIPYQVNNEGNPISTEGSVLPNDKTSIIEYSKKIIQSDGAASDHSVMYQVNNQYVLPLKTYFISQSDVDRQLEKWLDNYVAYNSAHGIYKADLMDERNRVIYVPYISNAEIISNVTMGEKLVIPVIEESDYYMSCVNKSDDEQDINKQDDIKLTFDVDTKDQPLSFMAVTLKDNWQLPNVSQNLEFLNDSIKIEDEKGQVVNPENMMVHTSYEKDQFVLAMQMPEGFYLPDGKYSIGLKVKVPDYTKIEPNENYKIQLKNIAVVNSDYPVDIYGENQTMDYKLIYDKAYKKPFNNLVPIEFIVVGDTNPNNHQCTIDFLDNHKIGVFEKQGTTELEIQIKPDDIYDIDQIAFGFDICTDIDGVYEKKQNMTYQILKIVENDQLDVVCNDQSIIINSLPALSKENRNYVIKIQLSISNAVLGTNDFLTISQINNYEIPCEKATKKSIEVVPFLKQE